jgi:septum formation protein
MSVPVVLASSSPRRRELLSLLGLSFDVAPADVDESWRNGEAPEVHTERLAREKAAAVRRPGAVTVAADTIVVVDGEILGKPADAAEARAMLRRLAGRGHVVHTAIAVAYGERRASGVVSTRVWFRPLDGAAIAAYVATGEPMDKAGAYGIQGYGAVLVDRIEGDYFTVMGLGLARLADLLGEVGLRYAFGSVRPAS